MAIYKMIYRHPDNEPNQIEVIDEYCEAKNRTEAALIFDSHHGQGRVVAGPLLIDETKVPKGKTVYNKINPDPVVTPGMPPLVID